MKTIKNEHTKMKVKVKMKVEKENNSHEVLWRSPDGKTLVTLSGKGHKTPIM